MYKLTRDVFADLSRIEVDEKQADVDLVKRVLATNVYVDQRGEPRSTPLLLRYEPQIRSFLEGPTVPRSQEVRVDPSIPFVAVPADTISLSEHPDLIPASQVSEMAPPINSFKLMGKATGGSSSKANKGKGKSKNKGAGAGKKPKKIVTETPTPEQNIQATVNQEPPQPLPVIHNIDESDHREELAPRKKRGRTEVPSIPAKESSSNFVTWEPELLFGPGPISIQDIVLDESKTEPSAQVAHGLARVAYLPEDMKLWDSMSSGWVFCHVTRGIMMVSIYSLTHMYSFHIFVPPFLMYCCFLSLYIQATQGVLSMEARVIRMTNKLQKKDAEHEEKMAEVLANATANYKKLEDQHFKNVNVMKEVEEQARTEAANRERMEGELAEMKEKVKKLESKCILLIGKVREEGKAEGKYWERRRQWMKLEHSSRWCTTVVLGTDRSPP